MWKIPKGFYAILIIPVLTALGLFVAGFITPSTVLTDEGYVLRNIFFIAGASFLFFPLVTAGVMTYFNKRSNDRKKELVNNGTKGVAEILSREQTGLYINDLPQVRFRLMITMPDGKAFETEYKDVVSLLDLNSVTEGAKLPVFVDPGDERNILLMYE